MRTTTLRILLLLAVALTAAALLAACGGSGSTGARDEGGSSAATPAPAGTGEPFKIGFDEGFTGFMATDAILTEHGILTALAQIDDTWMGRPVEYFKADNGSDPVVAVDKARELVEKDGIQVMLGPIFSPANAAVTQYLWKEGGGVPSISIYGQPSDNLKTAHNLSFVPSGMFDYAGYMTGKYAAEELGYRTCNAINYEDTASHQLQAGFDRGFKEGGGTVLSTQYVPYDTQDFSSYLVRMKPADCTLFWIFSNGLAPFIKQYSDYGLTAPLITDMASNLNEPQMRDLGNLTGIYGIDFYTPQLPDAEYPLNRQFVEDYRTLYPDEYPNMDAYGGWLAVHLFLEAVKATGGDTTPSKLVEAMSTISLDSPAGKYTMSPYETMYVGTGDVFMMKTEDVGGGRIAWVPQYTYKQVLHVLPK